MHKHTNKHTYLQSGPDSIMSQKTGEPKFETKQMMSMSQFSIISYISLIYHSFTLNHVTMEKTQKCSNEGILVVLAMVSCFLLKLSKFLTIVMNYKVSVVEKLPELLKCKWGTLTSKPRATWVCYWFLVCVHACFYNAAVIPHHKLSLTPPNWKRNHTNQFLWQVHFFTLRQWQFSCHSPLWVWAQII